MKLAEALLIRSDLQKKLFQLKARIANNVKVQDGDSPNEDPNALIIEANQVITELATLIEKIHCTNALSQTSEGESLLNLLNKREELEMRHKLLSDAIDMASNEAVRYSPREIKWKVMVSVSALQKQADDLSMKLRKLNLVIQANNWQIDLVQ